MLGVVVAVGACSNIIGISSYEIDPKLDDATSTQGGKNTTGGAAHAGSMNPGDAGAGGDTTGDGGVGGTRNMGGSNTAGTTPVGGEAGAGGEGGTPPVMTACKSTKDCNDDIDCTTDTCLANGMCGHAPNDAKCDSTRCETCTVGLGCEAGATTEMEVLLNPSFDAATDDWDDSGSDITNIVVSAAAQSPTKVAKFGPVAPNAVDYQYDDLLQYVTLPPGVVDLTITGYYKLTPTTKLHPGDPDDYVVLAFYKLSGPGSDVPIVQFNSFYADDGAAPAWKTFTYSALPDEIALVSDGGDYTFDMVGHVYSAFQFDTLTLTAKMCQ